MAKGDSAMLLTQGTILVDVAWWDRYWGWKLPASFSPMLEKKLLTRFDFSLSSTASDPSSLFNGPIAFLNLGLFAFESRFHYSAVVLTSANRSLKCLALALRISAVIFSPFARILCAVCLFEWFKSAIHFVPNCVVNPRGRHTSHFHILKRGVSIAYIFKQLFPSPERIVFVMKNFQDMKRNQTTYSEDSINKRRNCNQKLK